MQSPIRFLLVALSLSGAVVGCASLSLPWSVESQDLSAEIRLTEGEIMSARAQVDASGRLNADEKRNHTRTLDAASADIEEAKNLLSLATPPLDRVERYIEDANARVYAVNAYLRGV